MQAASFLEASSLSASSVRAAFLQFPSVIDRPQEGALGAGDGRGEQRQWLCRRDRQVCQQKEELLVEEEPAGVASELWAGLGAVSARRGG